MNPFEASGPITIRQMLCYCAGIVREAPIGGYFDANYSTNEECLASVTGCVLVNPPNTKTCYSNVGPTIIGRAIETKTGVSFEEYQQKYVLGPLGMKDLAWAINEAILARALQKESCDSHVATEPLVSCETPLFDLGTTPAGSLVTTVGDLAKFVAFLMSGHGNSQLTPPILRADTLAEMMKVQLTDNAEGFGLGFINRVYRGHKVAATPDNYMGLPRLRLQCQRKNLV